jgi:spore coat-associated protein N
MSDQIAPAAPEEKAPTRTSVLLRNPRRLIIAAILLLVAIGVAVFTTATFTSASASPGNMVAAGSVQIDNSHEGTAIFTASGLVPGDSVNGTVEISNVGSSSGNFSMSHSNIVDTPPTPPFSAKLDLLVEDVTNAGSPQQLYSGKLNAMGTIQLGSWAAGEKHTYKFTTTFPNGTPAEDNPYKNASTAVDFVWNVVS